MYATSPWLANKFVFVVPSAKTRQIKHILLSKNEQQNAKSNMSISLEDAALVVGMTTTLHL